MKIFPVPTFASILTNAEIRVTSYFGPEQVFRRGERSSWLLLIDLLIPCTVWKFLGKRIFHTHNVGWSFV